MIYYINLYKIYLIYFLEDDLLSMVIYYIPYLLLFQVGLMFRVLSMTQDYYDLLSVIMSIIRPIYPLVYY